MNSARSSCARKVRALNHIWALYTLVCLSVLPPWTVAVLTICDTDLVETMQFVCGDRGFYGGEDPPPGYNEGRTSRGIVDDCCYKTCSLERLERYCGYPKTRSLLPTGRRQDDYLDKSYKKTFNSDNWISKLLQKKMIPESEDSNRSKHASGLEPIPESIDNRQ